jgi:LysM repeat protein
VLIIQFIHLPNPAYKQYIFASANKDWMKRLAFVVFTVFSLSVSAQTGRKMTRSEYLDTYKDLAMREMERTGIPASITLAQGAFESGDGNSTLARQGNNHFGIKCHDWNGKTIYHDDDIKNDCFRKYKSVEESYQDHSDFLKTQQRYAFLFALGKGDYKAWAKGLKDAGYATNPAYTQSIIKVIEDYQLYKYDQVVIAGSDSKPGAKKTFETTRYAGGRKILYNNRVKYIIAREGDNFTSLSEELDLLSWQLPKYNELPEETVFKEGQVVYLQPKRNRAEAGKKLHKVKEGETLFSISQLYAIKIDKLARRNLLNDSDTLKAGDTLMLRGRKKGEKPQSKATNTETDKNAKDDDFKIQYNLDK